MNEITDLEFSQGIKQTLSIPITDYNDQYYDLNGRTITFKCKNNPDTDEYTFNRSILIDYNTNIYVLELSTADTLELEGEYPFEIRFSEIDDPNEKIFELTGKLVVRKSL